MKKIYCRAFQKIMYIGSFVLPWREPKILRSNADVVKLLRDKAIKSVLIVTDRSIARLGLADSLIDAMGNGDVVVSVYDEVVPNPTIANVEAALNVYKQNNCNAIIGFGGGSSIDCAKAVAACTAKPRKSIRKMKGLFKVLKRTPLTIAIPTTSGTGSETTVAAVIVDEQNHHKYAINDLSLIPHYALMDVNLTFGLPPFVTATTGMDALTHAVEAYIGKSNTDYTRECATEAVKLIFSHLETAYHDGKNEQSRIAMQQASYLAGAAFTRAYVGNIHAISHALSGLYGTAHGLANAVTLPIVLEYYGTSVEKPLSELARLIGLKTADELIAAIKSMNARMGIPARIDGIKTSDFELLSTYAEKEANPLYPVPVIFRRNDFIEILRRLKNDNQ